MNSYIKEIELDYDQELLLEEAMMVDYKPFELSKPIGSWFDYAPTWLQGRSTSNLIETTRLQNIIQNKIGSNNVKPRFYRQESNTEVPVHQDNGTLCAINIILSDSYGPIVFEDLSNQVFYKCAFLNVTQKHSVPAFPEERILLKFSIFDVDYDTAVERWLK